MIHRDPRLPKPFRMLLDGLDDFQCAVKEGYMYNDWLLYGKIDIIYY